MRDQYFHGALGGFHFGSFLATSGSGSVFDALEGYRARVRFLGIFQLPVNVFGGDLQHVLHVLVENAYRRLPWIKEIKEKRV